MSKEQETISDVSAEDIELVHECKLEDIDEIKRRGLHGHQKTPISTHLENGKYYLPKEVDDNRGYGEQLVTHQLEEHRPSDYPPRTPCIWVFCNWPRETIMERRGAVSLDANALLADYTLYAADFEIADELYINTINAMEFANCIDASKLERQCKEYWKSVKKIHSIEDIPDTLCEIYIPTRSIDTTYFTNILRSDNGKDYNNVSNWKALHR